LKAHDAVLTNESVVPFPVRVGNPHAEPEPAPLALHPKNLLPRFMLTWHVVT
jgi:hypothetical protein